MVATIAVHSQKASLSIYVLLALLAGIIISMFPNPIYLIKTQLLLQKLCMSTVRHLWSEDRLCSHYRGLSASLARVLEGAMYIILCEQMRNRLQ